MTQIVSRELAKEMLRGALVAGAGCDSGVVGITSAGEARGTIRLLALRVPEGGCKYIAFT